MPRPRLARRFLSLTVGLWIAMLPAPPARSQEGPTAEAMVGVLAGLEAPSDLEVPALRQQVTDRIKAKADAIALKRPLVAPELNKLPQFTQITRHICVEGWSAIGSWTGTPLRDFLKLVGADTRAKYVWFQCADSEGYNSPLDMRTALHPQTQMTFKFADEILPRAYGYPMKIRVPTKLGFKNPKYVISMEVTNDYKGGYWEDQGYNSFSGS